MLKTVKKLSYFEITANKTSYFLSSVYENGLIFFKNIISAKTTNGEIEKTYSFDVEEYVLPKFEVTVAGDNFIIKNDGNNYAFNIEGAARSLT